jgi:SAM-dependent MidA family methyltransferase
VTFFMIGRYGCEVSGWRAAMSDALYGPDGFFVRPDPGPAGHFRTSVHASPQFAGALLRLVAGVDEALGRPDPLDLVDVGAGRGELLRTLCGLAPPELAARLRPVAVELAPRPPDLPAAIGWRADLPAAVTGVLLATEWLDNVPLDVAEGGRYVEVDPATGRESPGGPLSAADADWLARWWPGRADGERAEIGRARDEAWAAAVARVPRGLALAVDYGHLRTSRPAGGTLVGYRAGRQVAPVPDGSCDLTAHVAMDAVAEAGGDPYTMITQREALRALGVDGARPPLGLAATDPAGYVRALAAASAAAELTDPGGLGGHWWLVHPRDLGGVARWPA